MPLGAAGIPSLRDKCRRQPHVNRHVIEGKSRFGFVTHDVSTMPRPAVRPAVAYSFRSEVPEKRTLGMAAHPGDRGRVPAAAQCEVPGKFPQAQRPRTVLIGLVRFQWTKAADRPRPIGAQLVVPLGRCNTSSRALPGKDRRSMDRLGMLI